MSSFNLRKMFSFDIFWTNKLDFTKTIIPLALMAYESIAHSAFGLVGYLTSWSKKYRDVTFFCKLKLDINPFFTAKTLQIWRALFATSGL